MSGSHPSAHPEVKLNEIIDQEPATYSNRITLTISQSGDMKMSFFQDTAAKIEGSSVQTIDRNLVFEVFVTLATAKRLLPGIQKMVEMYEADFGEIQLEPKSKK